MTSVDPPLLLPRAEQRRAGEEAEVDGEAVAVLKPRLSPVEEHAGPRGDAVDRDRLGERARVRRVLPDELEHRESPEQEDRRPQPEPVRIRTGLPVPAHLAGDPGGEIRRRPPRVEHGPDVAEHDADQHHAHPEDDVDERRGEVLARAVRAELRQPTRGRRTGRASPPGSTRRVQSDRTKRCSPSGSGVPAPSSSFGRFQSAPSARNERMSTVAPPMRNSQPGTGRSLIPPRP